MSETFTQSNRRVLVIDDNHAIHADFRKVLCPRSSDASGLDAIEAGIFGASSSSATPRGFQVESALQGQEGYEMVQQALALGQPYSVIFMDMRMPPGWDGIETTSHIWEVAPDTQIVICTAYSDYSWDDMISRLGISDRLVILKKPFDNVEVIQLAHALTEKWRLRQEARLKLEQVEAMVVERTRELQTANEQLKVEMAERVRTEEALRQSQKMEALGQLAGGIAHDFNNLLTVIRGYVDCLLLDDHERPDTLAAIQEIGAAADRAAKLTSQILMFSRKKRMQPQELDLNQVISRLGNMLDRLLGENVHLQIECGLHALPVHADPGMMEQVIINLAMNARDAMPAGGKLSIQARAVEIAEAQARNNPRLRPGRFACVSVADTGSGIAPAVLPHLFDPFFTTKEPGKGTGLGLSTVYGIIQQHQGWIEVENQPGSGALFRFFIPANGVAHHPGVESRPKSDLPCGNETILLVEDDPVVHRLARTFLERQGYRVHNAATGREALAVWTEYNGQFDLLLTDMVMPGKMSGRELAQMLQAEDPGLKVIYTTGYSPDALKMENALKEGINFIPKPYVPEKLAQIVRRCLDAAPTLERGSVTRSNVSIQDAPA